MLNEYKGHLNLTIDKGLIERAKRMGVNISGVTERALQKEVGLLKPELDLEIDFCQFCGVKGPKETKETLNKDRHALSWLWPDEKWICNGCLKDMQFRATVAAEPHY